VVKQANYWHVPVVYANPLDSWNIVKVRKEGKLRRKYVMVCNSDRRKKCEMEVFESYEFKKVDSETLCGCFMVYMYEDTCWTLKETSKDKRKREKKSTLK